MRNTRKNILKFILLGIMVGIFCSCGHSFKSIKEIDDHIDTRREDGVLRSTLESAGAVRVTSPEVAEQRSGVGAIAMMGIGFLSGNVLSGGIFAAAEARPNYGEIKTKTITGKNIAIKSRIAGYPIITYRKEPGKSEWNLGTEAIKRAGELPIRNTGCVVKQFDPVYSHTNIGLIEYKGEDGEIKIKMNISPALLVYGKPETEPECTMEDLFIYKDYITKLTLALAQIIKEETDRLDEEILKKHPDITNETGRQRGKIRWTNSDTKELSIIE